MESTEVHADGAQGGDAESFNALYERLAPALFAWARIRLGQGRDGIEAEDVMQEVWLRAIEGFQKFDSRGPGSFRAWIFKIASHVYIEIMRRRSASPAGAPGNAPGSFSQVPAEVTSITAGLRRSETIELLIQRINGLEPQDRQLFIHRGLEGMKAAATAEVLDLPEEVVHKRWQRLRTKLLESAIFSDLVDPESLN